MSPSNYGGTAVANATGAAPWPPPDRSMVSDDRVTPPPFDWDAVPPVWKDWVAALSEDCGAPPDYVFAALLAAASAALGNARRIAPWGGWVEPPHLWFALVGNPSSGKTPALHPFRGAMHALEVRESPAHEVALRDHAGIVILADFAEKKWKEEVKTAHDSGHAPPPRPPAADKPPAPALPRLVVSDATIEFLGDLLSRNPKGLLLVRDELAGLIGQFDKYGGNGSDRAFYLECWNGGRYSIDRVKFAGQSLQVPFASLSIIGGIQPDRLREIHNGPDDGFAARFFYIYPAPLPPRRPTKPHHAERMSFLSAALGRLWALALGRRASEDQQPRLVGLTEAGRVILDKVRDETAEANKQDRALMAGWRGKNPGRLLRLALDLEYLRWAVEGGPEPEAVSEAAVVQAANYLDYAAAMFGCVLADASIDPAHRDAACVARHLIATGALAMNGRHLSKQQGFSTLRDREHRQKVFSILEDAGWIRPAPTAQGAGRKPDAWEVNPAIHEGR